MLKPDVDRRMASLSGVLVLTEHSQSLFETVLRLHPRFLVKSGQRMLGVSADSLYLRDDMVQDFDYWTGKGRRGRCRISRGRSGRFSATSLESPDNA